MSQKKTIKRRRNMKQNKVSLKIVAVLVSVNLALLLTIATQPTNYSVFAILGLVNGLAILRAILDRKDYKRKLKAEA